jgi:hypothetical protein
VCVAHGFVEALWTFGLIERSCSANALMSLCGVCGCTSLAGLQVGAPLLTVWNELARPCAVKKITFC